MSGFLSTVAARWLFPAALASSLIAACAGDARAQEASASQDDAEPPPATTRRIDYYGEIGHCDESARLDNFAITLQNEPGSTGYLLVYVGRNDMPAWKDAILQRAAGYLVNSRGLAPERLKVVDGGYREERTTELWVVAGKDAPPGPTDAVEVKLDKSKAYQWNEQPADIEFNADPEPAEADSEEAVADEPQAEAPAAAGAKVAGAEVDAWRKEVEKYQIAVVTRGVLEDESEGEPEAEGAEEAEAGAASEGDAEPEQEEPPLKGVVKISMWWDVERLAGELKGAPGARLRLVYYYGAKNATREKMRALVEQALAKTGEQLGLKGERVMVVDGGRGEPGVELWVVPAGAEPPQPRPGTKRNFGFYSAPGED